MTGFNEEYARDAAAMIPGLNAVERATVVEALRSIAEEFNEPDMTLKEARALAASLQAAVEKVDALTRRLRNGWGPGGGTISFDLYKALGALSRANYDTTHHAATIADELAKVKVKGGHGGVVAQVRGSVKKRHAAHQVAMIWFRATLTSPREDGDMFLEVGTAAVTGDEDGAGERLAAEVCQAVEDYMERVTNAERLALLARIDATPRHTEDTGKPLRALYRRLLEQTV